MLYLVKVCFKNGMCHSQSFDNKDDRDAMLIEIVDQFLTGSMRGTVVDGIAFRFDDVLIITGEDIDNTKNDGLAEEGVC